MHTGAIGYYTSMAAAEGLAGIGIVAGVPNMAYEGARGAGVATSPLAIALPASKHPDFVLDMATATIALGKIAQYKARGELLPEGVAVTADGLPTVDPAEAKIPLPVGGAKGSGMSLAFELLASGLAANPIVSQFHAGVKGHRQNATLIAVDISAFLPLADFKAIVDDTIDAVTGLPPAGSAPVLVPGARGAASYDERVARRRAAAPEDLGRDRRGGGAFWRAGASVGRITRCLLNRSDAVRAEVGARVCSSLRWTSRPGAPRNCFGTPSPEHEPCRCSSTTRSRAAHLLYTHADARSGRFPERWPSG